MARMRTVRTGSSPARRRKVWTNTDVDITLTGPTAVDLLASYRSQPGAVGAGLTVMGVIFQHRVTEAAEVTAQSAIDLGIIVDRSPAADVPNPSDDEFADWMWNSRYYVDIGGEHWENPFAVDQRVKSRRRLDEVGDSLFVSFGLKGLTTATYSGHFRVLLALP